MKGTVTVMAGNGSRPPSAGVRSTILITQLQGLAQFADHEELVHIARRATQLAHDLSLAMSDLSQHGQPRRSAAFMLLKQIEGLAAEAGPDDLAQIASQAMQLANDLVILAAGESPRPEVPEIAQRDLRAAA